MNCVLLMQLTRVLIRSSYTPYLSMFPLMIVDDDGGLDRPVFDVSASMQLLIFIFITILAHKPCTP